MATIVLTKIEAMTHRIDLVNAGADLLEIHQKGGVQNPLIAEAMSLGEMQDDDTVVYRVNEGGIKI